MLQMIMQKAMMRESSASMQTSKHLEPGILLILCLKYAKHALSVGSAITISEHATTMSCQINVSKTMILKQHLASLHRKESSKNALACIKDLLCRNATSRSFAYICTEFQSNTVFHYQDCFLFNEERWNAASRSTREKMLHRSIFTLRSECVVVASIVERRFAISLQESWEE
jgi:hypothetical protein